MSGEFIPPSAAEHIASQFFLRCEENPESVLYSQLCDSEDGVRVTSHTRAEVATRVRRLAAALHQLGIGVGAHVALLSSTRPEWSECEMACLSLGAVLVTIYPSLTPDEIGFILYDAGCSAVIVENDEQWEKVRSLLGRDCKIPQREDRPAETVRIHLPTIISMDSLASPSGTHRLADIIAAQPAQAKAPPFPSSLCGDSLASLVYTSGTTGAPKGVMQLHRNFVANVRQAAASKMFAPNGRIFLFLPLAHSFPRLISHVGFLSTAHLIFPRIPPAGTQKSEIAKRITTDMRLANAELIPSVPRVFEKMQEGIEHEAQKRSLKGWLLRKTLQAGREVHLAKISGRAPRVFSTLFYEGLSPIREKIKAQLFGPHFSHAISGGAKLPKHVGEFFAALNLPIYEGYGLTETCVATHVNRHDCWCIGSVGPALPGVETQISETDGEILLRGPNISAGYWNRPSATADSWDQAGWFHTGDVGHIDENGCLFITGRKKELIVTAGGKKIPPLAIESSLTQSKYISQAVLCGEGRPYCVALIVPDTAAVRRQAEFQGRQLLPKLSEDAFVQELIQSEVEAVNAELASFETVKRFRIVDEEFSMENGLLTPTLKIRRGVVTERYQATIDEMYR